MNRIPAVSAAALLLAVSSIASAEVDFLSQTISVDLASSPDEITVHAELHLRAVTDTDKLKIVALAPGVTSLAWNGIPLQTTSTSTVLTAILPAPITAGTEGVLTADLAGAPNCAYSGYVMCQHAADLTYLMPPWVGTSWYLDNAGSSYDPQLVTLQMRVAEGHNAAALGVVPTVSSNGDGTDTFTFTTAREVAQIALVSGTHEAVQGDAAGFPTRGLYTGGDVNRELMQAIIDEGGKLAPVFGDLWGQPHVEEFEYGMITGHTAFAGTEIEGLFLVHETIFAPAYQYLVPAVNHELAHYWWGTLAWAKGMLESGFFTESLAEYSLWRGKGILEGREARDTGTRMNAVWYMYRRPGGDDRPVLTTMGSEVAVFSVYHKGSTVVRTLEEAVGAEALDTALANLVTAGPGQATIAGFTADLQSLTSVDVASYIDAWLKGTGFPVITLTPTVEASGTGWRVELVAASDDFPMKLPVVALLDDGTVVDDTLEIASGAGATTFDVPARPIAIEIDPGWTAVREVRPSAPGDVSLDGKVDGDDLIEVALRVGTSLPTIRRKDGAYDPIYDVDADRKVGDADLDEVVARATD